MNTSATGGYLIPAGWETRQMNTTIEAYSKDEVNNLLENKADKASLAVYATAEQLSLKADANTVYTKDDIDGKIAYLEGRISVLEAKSTPKGLYFFLPSQVLLLSSSEDKYITGFETNLDVNKIEVSYSQVSASTVTFESQTQMKIHYVDGSAQNAKFTLTYSVTGEKIGDGYLCTSYNGSKATKIIWIGVGE